ncbi:MAG: phosphoribosylformylglycinamidine synthase subunit PurS [Bacteroidetes bacterium]|nr:phosphoribosylformylglycinamidine synthase subunit PurS [Bacteroidota bacterium]
MKFLAEIEILPLKGLLDPQGKAVSHSMPSIGLQNVHDVRVGKFITMEIEANDHQQAEETAEVACKKLLANLIMESYHIRISLPQL